MPFYTAFVDGSSRGNPGPAGIGIAIFADDNPTAPVVEISRSIGTTTNNVAEYEAVIAALKWLIEQGAKTAAVKMDSELVFKQINGEYRVKIPHLVPLNRQARSLLTQAGGITICLIPRTSNKLANRLAQRASAVHAPQAVKPD